MFLLEHMYNIVIVINSVSNNHYINFMINDFRITYIQSDMFLLNIKENSNSNGTSVSNNHYTSFMINDFKLSNKIIYILCGMKKLGSEYIFIF